MCGKPTEVRISNIPRAKQLLTRIIAGRIAHVKEVSADWTISGFGIRFSGHFHRTTADVLGRDGDDGR